MRKFIAVHKKTGELVRYDVMGSDIIYERRLNNQEKKDRGFSIYQCITTDDVIPSNVFFERYRKVTIKE